MLVDENRSLFAVADGVTNSSHGSGAIAAELAVKLLSRNFEGDLAKAVARVHEIALETRVKDWSIGETTITAAAIAGGVLQISNVGDSPAYLARDGNFTPLAHEDKTLYGSISQTIGYPPEIRVNSQSQHLQDHDVIIIASDGVSHVLRPPLIFQLLGKPGPNQIADGIIASAKAMPSGYDDDKSVIVIRFSSN